MLISTFTGVDVLRKNHGRYTRNTLNIQSAVAKLINAKLKPRTVIMVGSYKSSAKFIKLAKNEISDLIFFNLFFVGAHALSNAPGEDADGDIVIQAVPHSESELLIADKYRLGMSRYMQKNRWDLCHLKDILSRGYL